LVLSLQGFSLPRCPKTTLKSKEKEREEKKKEDEEKEKK